MATTLIKIRKANIYEKYILDAQYIFERQDERTGKIIKILSAKYFEGLIQWGQNLPILRENEKDLALFRAGHLTLTK